jgi:beta-glucanase (GH16 family)
MRSPRPLSFLGAMTLLLAVSHCGGDDNSGGSGGGAPTGGAAGSGGSGATGGSAGSGGSTATGGTTATGGGAGAGGAAGSGSGGSAGSGGSTPGPTGVGGSWTLVWHDEFDGSSLDLSKWRPNWFGSTDTAVTVAVNVLEVSCYDPAQVSVSGGNLELTAVATTNAACKKKDGSQASYASGLVMSDGRYNFTYGFVEARMWLPPGTGTPENWAAFWVNGQVWPEDGEIDVMETLGGGSDTRWTYHYDSDTGAGTTHSQITGTPNNMISGAGWHVFGANWQPDEITFYYDGKSMGSVASSDLAGGAKTTSSPHYFIVNHGLNGNYAVKVPSTLKIDYVRHWQ